MKNITIQKILSVLLSRLKFIILATVLMGALFFSYSKFLITPMYSTSSMIYIQNYSSEKSTTPSNQTQNQTQTQTQNSNKTSNDQNQKIYVSDITGSSTLASVCVTLFKNSDAITSIYDGCYVNMALNPDTFFVTINVSGDDPQKCANVANQIAEKCEEVFKKFFKYGHLGTIREAKVPTAPYEPSNFKNGLIGMFAGLLLSCLISILIALIDTTIKADDDIQEMYGIPVFAAIPDFESLSR